MHFPTRSSEPGCVINHVGHVALEYATLDKVSFQTQSVARRPDERVHSPGDRLPVIVLIVFVGASCALPGRQKRLVLQKAERLVQGQEAVPPKNAVMILRHQGADERICECRELARNVWINAVL